MEKMEADEPRAEALIERRRAPQCTPSPLAGEGWGRGCAVVAATCLIARPPPCPSPTRGEGTMWRAPSQMGFPHSLRPLLRLRPITRKRTATAPPYEYLMRWSERCNARFPILRFERCVGRIE